ncbi:glycosyl hydrolase [Anaeromicropila herbilytica]|uniref:Endo-1,4-beta-glucanase n=1 Tax=Anaeromicropila herbilytica TaxID=2785025 RepID=A0A7R7EJQ1_9FIRM|nr:glycosyl hydrolase [Anaeromicropila herbilytica]BCN30045.1 hypothetical protein bsdtb5_13400 [Anaeromicropila herbilytica]
MKRGKRTVMAMMLILGMITSLLLGNTPGVNTNLLLANNTNTVQAAETFSTKIEAENATMTGDIKAASTRAGFSGTGYATGFDQKSNNSWSVQVEIPTTKHYTFVIRSASDSYKENYLYINGKQAATIYSKGDGAWNDTTIESVYLEKGTITLSIKESWGWFDLDYINIEDGTGIKDSVYNTATSTLVNQNANQKTKNIMEYLKSIYGNQTLSGQSCTLNTSTEVDALYKYTGKYPAIRMLDMIFCDPASDWHNTEEINQALNWDKKGGLVTFQWHWHAPKGGNQFYANKTSFDLSKAVTTEDISMLPLSEIKSMYEAGKISEECYLLVRDIDAISGYLDQLQQANVTVLWRPLHEASGGWFWWGAKGKDPYLWLYKLMFNRQTNYHKLNNLIWVWNGQDASWYPGDNYCDISGTDIYAEKHTYNSQSDQLMKTINYSSGNKMAALSENGVMIDPDMMLRDNAYWLYFAVWYGDFLMNTSGEIGDTYTEAAMVKKVYQSDKVITLDELPNFNSATPTVSPTIAPTTTPTAVPTATPTVTPTAIPTTIPTSSPTIAPTVVPTITPTVAPTTSPTGDFTLSINNTGNGKDTSNTINNNIILKNVSGSDIDLSKLSIRYYYTKEGASEETFYCDTAAVQLNKAPYYASYLSSINHSFVTMSQPKTNADTYLEIKLNTTDKLSAGSTLTITTRSVKNDWSIYNQINDYSYGNSNHIVVYYDGKLVLGVEP